MLQDSSGIESGERTAVGIDPCKEFLQLAILSHKKKPEFRKLPLLPSIMAEIAKSTVPERTPNFQQPTLFCTFHISTHFSAPANIFCVIFAMSRIVAVRASPSHLEKPALEGPGLHP